jgi:hypothetical protein
MDSLDKRSYRASFDRIRTHLNFACDKTLEYGIREILDAISLGKISDFTASLFNNQLITQSFAESGIASNSL